MKQAFFLAAVLVPLSADEGGTASIDRRIDHAAAAIVASRLGDLRGSFRFDETPVFVTAEAGKGHAPASPRGSDGTWRDGLTPALPPARQSGI
jgi:hypothetical protein